MNLPENSNGMVSFRIVRKNENSLLMNEVIENNLCEADQMNNTQYILFASVAWLRANPGSTLRDLDVKFAELGINTIIVAEEHDGPIGFEPDKNDDDAEVDFDLCIPGNPDAKPIYVASFIHDMRDFSADFLSHFHGCTTEDNFERLELAGYMCAKGKRSELTTITAPDINQVKHSNIMNQLQWANISIIVIPIDMSRSYQEECMRVKREYGREPMKYKVKLGELKQEMTLLLVPSADRSKMRVASEFGLLHKDHGVVAPGHMKTMVRNSYREIKGLDTVAAESYAHRTLLKALEKFTIEGLILENQLEALTIVGASRDLDISVLTATSNIHTNHENSMKQDSSQPVSCEEASDVSKKSTSGGLGTKAYIDLPPPPPAPTKSVAVPVAVPKCQTVKIDPKTIPPLPPLPPSLLTSKLKTTNTTSADSIKEKLAALAAKKKQEK